MKAIVKALVIVLALLPAPAFAGGIGTIMTAAGPIVVASGFAPRISGFIRDLVAAGYRPRHIGCYARGGHVAHSLHYSGNACDFDQTRRNRTARMMYRVGWLAAKWGLRDGCSFHDCGHIDNGLAFGGRYNIYAALHRSRRHNRHAYRTTRLARTTTSYNYDFFHH